MGDEKNLLDYTQFLGEQEVAFAAAAHYFMAIRDYRTAEQVMALCNLLVRLHDKRDDFEQLRMQMNACRSLISVVFYGYSNHANAVQVQAMRKSLVELNEYLTNKFAKLDNLQRGKANPPLAVYKLLEQVKKRPAMYLAKQDLNELNAFLEGIRVGVAVKELEEEYPPFSGFTRWVSDKWPEFQGGGSGWAIILLRAADDDGKKAFNMFFNELKAYRASVQVLED